MSTNSAPLNNFSIQAGSALAAALRYGVPLLEPEHLLLGLLAQSHGMAIHALQRLGIQPESLYSALAVPPLTESQRSSSGQLSPQTKQVIEFALQEALHLQHTYIGTEHMLLGLLCGEENKAQKLLHDHGLSLDALRAEVEQLHAQGETEQVQRPSSPAPADIPQKDSGPQVAPPTKTTAAGGTVPLSSARQQLANSFARSRQRARLWIILTTALITVVVISSGPQFGWLSAFASVLANTSVLNWHPIGGWFPLLVMVYFLLVMIPLLIVIVPLTWYLSFALPRRYGLIKGTTWGWLSTLSKALLLFCLQMWLFVEVIALFMAIQPQTWWAWSALIQFLYSILMARFGSRWRHPLLQHIEPLSEGELTGRLQALLTRLRIASCGIYQAKISHRANIANAFFTGWGTGRRIILTDTLIQNFTPDEIEVILAHELGHLVHHDIWTRLVLRGLLYLGILYVLFLLQSFYMQADPLQLVFLLAALILLFVFASLSTRYRRHQEYQADEFALQLTGNVPAFKNAMTRLTDMNLLVAASTRHARHPASHPTLVKRLAHADEFAARQVHV